ncbi:unnamed protein product [Cuscuta campestris]|uniref:Chromo domain-containing protein n=1 Tax=Cuscuta campestris TaxID=132261 RepID=A0A484M8Y8_9ASTE|nr:unnamed protein product [Cuscuta campestris]
MPLRWVRDENPSLAVLVMLTDFEMVTKSVGVKGYGLQKLEIGQEAEGDLLWDRLYLLLLQMLKILEVRRWVVTHDDSLSYEEELVQILAQEVKELRNKKVILVKVLWCNHDVEKATWETKESMRVQFLCPVRRLRPADPQHHRRASNTIETAPPPSPSRSFLLPPACARAVTSSGVFFLSLSLRLKLSSLIEVGVWDKRASLKDVDA